MMFCVRLSACNEKKGYSIVRMNKKPIMIESNLEIIFDLNRYY